MQIFSWIYTALLSSVLCEPPFKQINYFDTNNLQKYTDKIHWVCDPLDELVERVGKSFQSTDVLLIEIKKITGSSMPSGVSKMC